MAENPLIAPERDSTTAWSGIGIAESAADYVNGITSGSWLEMGLGTVGIGLEALAIAMDPAGALLSYGISWMIEHVKPLSDALDWLAGNPDAIRSFAETWRNVATAVSEVATEYAQTAASETAAWIGAAADAYRAHAAKLTELLTAGATAAQGVGAAVEMAGVIVGIVRETVRDLIADLVSRLIVYAIELLASWGIAAPVVVSQAMSLIARWTAKIAEIIRKLVRSLNNLRPLLRNLEDVFADITRLLPSGRRADGLGTGAPAPAQITPDGPPSGGPRDPNGPGGPGDRPDGLSPDGSRPELDREALRDRDTFENEYQRILDERGLDRAEHDRLRSTPSDELTEAEARQIIEVRDAIRADPGTVMAKVLHPDQAAAYLDNLTSLNGRNFDPGTVGGFAARGTDVADVNTPQGLRDALALDDRGAGWTPIREGADSGYQLRYLNPDGANMPVAYGGRTDAVADRMAELGGVDGRPIVGDAPFVGTGYTAGGVPEWQARGVSLGDRAEIWELDSSGNEVLRGVYTPGDGWRRL